MDISLRNISLDNIRLTFILQRYILPRNILPRIIPLKNIPLRNILPQNIPIREGFKKRPFFIVFYYEGVRTPTFIVTWDSEIVGPYFKVVVDAIGPETDFTLETNVKE